MNLVTVFSQLKKYTALEKNVKKTALVILKILKKEKTHVEFFLISDSEIKKINKKFRGKDKATNVLSFEESRGFGRPKKEKFLGEIYIAPDFIRRNQPRRAVGAPTGASGSLEHMIVHGLLHLCGYDHVEKKEAEIMEKKEIDILSNV